MVRWQSQLQLQMQKTVPLLTRMLGSSSLFSPFHQQRRPLLHPQPLPPPPPQLSSASSTFVAEHPRQQWAAVHRTPVWTRGWERLADHRRAVSRCRRAGLRYTWEWWWQWRCGSYRGSPRQFPWEDVKVEFSTDLALSGLAEWGFMSINCPRYYKGGAVKWGGRRGTCFCFRRSPRVHYA